MIRLSALILMLATGAAAACEAVRHRDRAFTVCTADLASQSIELELLGDDGAPLGSFVALDRAVDAPIAFAMNAGMYHADRRPVGLYIQDGVQSKSIVTREGPGNFGLLPNGVFCVRGDRADVIESRTFAADPPACDQATQSGPMLVIDGALHPRFLPESPSAKVRNGVGATPDGRTVHFVISDQLVTFHEMATLYRDVLGVRNALFLDGSVSRLFHPASGRSDGGRQMGPIVVVTGR
ncbi:phosphodiester glycosidase family protein [Jannaschia donghaensis]|uniref:Exopolysaccharide biosynthesis protein related to N-acetylglucosamine-1-phosphodiester alpha-N-acetylglucosaminidase n=1 Tax=Jannaschia donghaensis TaxID=420998 RepID=A0A0M6YEG5_9RHOB|nr:phosphodiester glycosidase family protein [Jannaschia donghaensis]CTQ48360.1 Exopolysaccharide biosynthesis protein related to N-acetylglucosamine-1-phosphodiester alpha-N-acetylglucosaminidase [Jannaschia donghaensis]